MGEFAYIGEASAAALIPLWATTQAELSASLSATLPEIEARVTGMLEVQAGLVASPPTLAAQLEAAMAVVANLQAGMPSISLDLTLMASAIAELQGIFGTLQASLEFSLSIASLLATAGIYAWTYEGEASGLVPGWAPSGVGSAPVWGIVLAASATASQTALQTMFGVG